MKIGIVTVHDSANFGSFLQAYALKLALQDLGHEVTFIKTRSNKKVKKIFQGNIRNFQKYIKNFSYNREKYDHFLKDFKKNREILLKDVKEDTFDVVIIGSDELWNVNTPVFRNTYFYGEQIPTKKKIAYAISSGNATSEELAKYPNLLEAIKKLDKIYTRDENTKNNLIKLLKIETEMVCDPTFLIDVNRMENNYQNPIKENYILIYTYYLKEGIVQKVKEFAKKNKLKLVAVCMKQEWCDENVNCSPLEFCQLIKESKYVITTTFHGTIFSILNKKDFISIPTSCKVNDLLKKLELSDRIISENISYEKMEEKLVKKIDFEKSNEKIKEMREESLEHLIKAIEKKYRRR